MSSACNSESDTELGIDWTQKPIKSRSFYNSRFRNVMQSRQKTTHSTSPTSTRDTSTSDHQSSASRRSLLPTPPAALGVGMIPPMASSQMSGVERYRVTSTSGPEQRPYRKFLEICSQDIGAILGRAGSTVMRVERQYNVAVYLDRQRLLLIVRGGLQVQVNDALVDICKIITENRCRGNWSSMHQTGRQSAGGHNNNSWRSTSIPGISRKKFPFPAREFTFNYRESPEVTALGEGSVLALRDTNHIVVVFNNCEGFEFCWPRPVWLFEQAFVQYGNNWAQELKERYGRPTVIQGQGWPILLQGHDLIGVARSGMGKTLTYLLPSLLHSDRLRRRPGLSSLGADVLVLVPTRDAAMQVEQELQNFSNGQASCLLLVDGSTNTYSQLDQRVQWIIGTPVRIAELLDIEDLHLSDISLFIIDGAFRLLAMGLEPHLYRIAESMRMDRLTVIMSIRWDAQVHRLANRLTLRPVLVCISPRADPTKGIARSRSTKMVRQLVYVLHEHDKFGKLMSFLCQMTPYDKVVIFCSTKERATELSLQLGTNNMMNACLHSLLGHEERSQILSDVGSGYVRILLATDLVAHGLDIEDINHVVNYDFPPGIADYVLRVERTARSGRLGNCISYITSTTDSFLATQLIAILEAGMHEVPIELRQMDQRVNQNRQERRTMSASSSVRRRGPCPTGE
ncbi:uncharacterized protein Dwil_GK17566 [Drosophila willistoni]|uniref:RNA helicase n=1 Tax=Drosophila willistoni TaxID=7260 RepID=B4NP98_DROWI|nr:DEAD-box ATP-dependent RNA helicase 20 [Drosophila willistoni]EDW86338.1 uncharacterized protein Dwil_GK17566 [Drosophila willistoni]